MIDPISSRSAATEAQIQKLLALLRLAPRHTHELRALGVSHPAGRVLDLQKRGYSLSSTRVTTVDSDGYSHAGVAMYSLDAEPEEDFRDQYARAREARDDDAEVRT